MPIIKSAVKRMKQTAVRRARNQKTKQDVKTAVKAFIATPSAATLSAAHGAIDTAVKKNTLKKTTAARRKSTLSRIAKDAGVKLEKTAKKPAAKAPAKKPAAKKPAAKTAAKKPATKKAPAAKKPAAKKASK